jgi:hypothetical protein
MKTSITIFTLSLLMLLACHTGASLQNDPTGEIPRLPALCPEQQELKVFAQQKDFDLFESAIEHFQQQGLENAPVSHIIRDVSRYFLKTPYVASTLEIPGEEQLVINLGQMDCTTYVEYVVALSIAIKQGNLNFSNFAHNLACLRYREGNIQGYPSRLHYFSEWLHHKADKGLLTLISDTLGSDPFVLSLNFMSKNPKLYPQLANPDYVKSMQIIEESISLFAMKYIPKQMIQGLENDILDGDIIAFTTNIAGLDVTHTGFALHLNGRLHLIHASTRSMQVEITPVPLSDYLKPMNRVTGILAARVNY